MTYPTVADYPSKIRAAAHYGLGSLTTTGKSIAESFTFKDKFGEPYTLYKQESDSEILVPRNCTPPGFSVNDEQGIATEYLYHTSAAMNWGDGFKARNSEQTRVVEESVHYLNSQFDTPPGMILEAPTGFGKTYCGSSIIQRMDQSAIVITTKEDIFAEWVSALAAVLCIDESAIGQWRGDTLPDKNCSVVVSLVQSVCKGYDRYPREIYERFGLVMVDEVHRMGADKFSDAMWCFPARFRIGLSATPYRKDGRERVFQAHIGEVQVRTEQVPLSFKAICVDTEWENPRVWQYDPEINKSVLGSLEVPWGQASRCVKYLKDDEGRNTIIASFLKTALKKKRSTVVLSDTVEHLQIIHQFCVSQGISTENFGYYCGLTAEVYKGHKGRAAKLAAREAATISPIILATFKMCGEGTNIPWLDTMVLAAPKADVVQVVGRMLREYPEKEFPTLLDLCDYTNEVLAVFARARQKWYREMGVEIVHK